jgi:hypothetical protein
VDPRSSAKRRYAALPARRPAIHVFPPPRSLLRRDREDQKQNASGFGHTNVNERSTQSLVPEHLQPLTHISIPASPKPKPPSPRVVPPSVPVPPTHLHVLESHV